MVRVALGDVSLRCLNWKWTDDHFGLFLKNCDVMRTPNLSFPRAWMLVTACACGFLIWINFLRIRHIDYVSNVAGSPAAFDRSSATGFEGGVRQFIPAGQSPESYQWIAQTQDMLARGVWHVHHIDYDNVPTGRPVVSSSLYRWWLGAIANLHHLGSGQPLGFGVERAAVFSDPLLHILLVVVTAAFVAWQFGVLPAALIALGLSAFFPFASLFVPSQPQDVGLQLIAALWSVLPLLIVSQEQASDKKLRRYFFAAGAVGGIGLWLSVATELPILVGVIIGGLLAARLARSAKFSPLPWRSWALGGGSACLVAYVIDLPAANDLALHLEALHPLYGLAWLGAGELLARASGWMRSGKQAITRREKIIVILATIAVVIPLVWAGLHRHELFAAGPRALRLTAFLENAIAQDLLALVVREGFSLMLVATLLPLILLVPAVWLVLRLSDLRRRSAIALALGPVAIAAVLGYFHLRWWALLDAELLALLVAGASTASTSIRPRFPSWVWSALTATAIIPGFFVLSPARSATESVSESEVESLIERDLAHWLANRTGAGRAAIIASPDLAASLAFSGGLRALGSPYFENRDGLSASLRIAGSTSQDEAYALIQRRNVTHIVLASWDPSLERLAELGGDKEHKSLVSLLHRWQPPRWLKPIPYQMPQIPGFEGQSVVVFEVVELQDNPVALSHLAEYFVETGQTDLAAAAASALARLFPDDLGATVARIQATAAIGDQRGANETFKILEQQLSVDSAQALPWDRRVMLAIVLAEAKRYDDARTQLQHCLDEMDESRLRSLSTVSLYRCQKLIKAFGLTIPDKGLEKLSRSLLPQEMRSAL